jgi:hypothetical protein
MAKFPFQSLSTGEMTNEEFVARFADIAKQLDEMHRAALECLLKEDYEQARIFATGALLVLASIPDGQIGGIATQTWNKTGIQQFLMQLDKLESIKATEENGGIYMMPVEYTGRRGGRC